MALGPDKYRVRGGFGTPLRTFQEMAEEFGLTSQQLVGEMSQSPIPHPVPIYGAAHTRLSHKHSYYLPKPFRLWWKMHSQLKQPKGNAMAKNFIKKAIKHPGALHKQLGIPADKKIPAKTLAAAAKKPGKLGQRARFAQTLRKMHKK